MGEGEFPTPDAEDPLDLRWARRREGDVTTRERDKYAFLELLLGARDRLIASYVSREPLTGETLAPSSVVQELLHALERGYVGDGSSLRRRHPLRRWSPAYFPELFASSDREPANLGTMRITEARAEARTLALRRSLDASGEHVGAEDVLARAATDTRWALPCRSLGVGPASRSDVLFRRPHRRSGLRHREVFSNFPLQGWARFRVGLDERDEDDPMDREDEPFETDIRRETVFLREVLLDSVVAQQRSIEDAYDRAVRGRELRGAGPSGVFARGERGPHLETLVSWRDELAARGESRSMRSRSIVLVAPESMHSRVRCSTPWRSTSTWSTQTGFNASSGPRSEVAPFRWALARAPRSP